MLLDVERDAASSEASVTVATMVEGVSEEDIEGWHPLEAEDDLEDASVDEEEAMFRLSGEDELEYLRRAPLFLNTVSSTKLFCCSKGLGLLLMVLLLL